ncbi:MAG: hypothetical protein DCC58_08235 [Chloroflexi bacterium]|nr:MAG: hypothetical protein DCC58_08235 [Chloroflexota bacterium]
MVSPDSSVACQGTTAAHVPIAATILPFTAVRFDEHVPGGLAAVIGPPADLESSERAVAFVADRPYSAVRLEIADDPHGARFLQARRLFDRWRQNGTLRRDTSPSYYVYEQEFVERGVTHVRRGIFGLAPLGAPETVFLPHEDTWEENLRRRRHILRDIEASTSPILLLHDAASADLAPAFDATERLQPNGEGFDDDGQRHRLWQLSDERIISRVRAVLAGHRFMIADGHHRFAAARGYHHATNRPEAGFIPALCVAQDDPGVILRAIHRLFAPSMSVDWSQVLARAATWFELQTHPVARKSGAELAALLPPGELPVYGLLTSEAEMHVLRLRSFEVSAPFVARRRPVLRHLDVTIATDLLLHHVLGIDPSAAEVGYSNDPDQVVAAVRKREASAALLLRAPRIQQVVDVARAHSRMPQKSTSFVPKVPLGLVMYDFYNERDDSSYVTLR